MRCLKSFWFCLALVGLFAGPAGAQVYLQFEFDLPSGRQSGEYRPVSFTDAHIEIAPRGGGKSLKVPWGRLSQETLQRLVPIPKFGQYAIQHLDAPPQPPPVATNKVRIEIKPVDRQARPGQGELFGSPLTWFFLFMFYAGNIYAGYEVATFRNRNKYMVAGVCAIAPVVGLIIFLSLPTHEEPVVEETLADAEAPPEIVPIPPSAEEVAAQEAAAVAAAAPESKYPPTVVYTRGQTTFNRRFFETKLAGYLKVVPGEAEKDMVIFVTSSRGKYQATRLARIGPNDFTLLVVKGTASQEVTIPFNEISEVKIRHKDVE